MTANSTTDHTMDHTSSDKKGITRQGAVAMDPSRKGPPPIPTRASSTALTEEQQRQQQAQELHDAPTATKVPPKVAKKPKTNKGPTQSQTSTGT